MLASEYDLLLRGGDDDFLLQVPGPEPNSPAPFGKLPSLHARDNRGETEQGSGSSTLTQAGRENLSSSILASFCQREDSWYTIPKVDTLSTFPLPYSGSSINICPIFLRADAILAKI